MAQEFRVSYMRWVNLSFNTGAGRGVTLSSLGFVTGVNTSGIVVQNPEWEGVPRADGGQMTAEPLLRNLLIGRLYSI